MRQFHTYTKFERGRDPYGRTFWGLVDSCETLEEARERTGKMLRAGRLFNRILQTTNPPIEISVKDMRGHPDVV